MKKLLLGSMLALSFSLLSCNDNSSSGPDKKEGGGIEVPCNAENEGEVVSPADSDKEYVCKDSAWTALDSSRHCEDCKDETIAISSSSSNNNVVLSAESSSSIITSESDESSSSVIASETKQSSSEQSTESSSSEDGDSSSSVETTEDESSSSEEVEDSSSSEETAMFLCDDGVTYVLDLENCEVESSSSDEAEESSSSEEVEESSSSEMTPQSSSENSVESSNNQDSSSSEEESSSSNQVSTGICKTEAEDNCVYGELYDERDGQTYKTVKIGEQWWMAENLKFEEVGSANLKCQNDDPNNCVTYGYLYNWEAAINACPNNWRLPSRPDLNKLKSYTSKYKGNLTTGQALRSKDGGWDKTGVGEGADLFGLNIMAGGGWYNNTYKFASTTKKALFWQSDSAEISSIMYRCYTMIQLYLEDSDNSGSDVKIGYKSGNYSQNCVRGSYLYIRCIKD